MACDDDQKSRKYLRSEDIALWKEMTRDVKPLKKEGDAGVYLEPGDDCGDAEEDTPQESVRFSEAKESLRKTDIQGQEVDRRTADRFRRGQMGIEARLDLHGCSKDKAYEALRAFMRQAYARGQRCVLVITGKGRTGKRAADSVWLADDARGILRRAVPEWLAEPDMKAYVLKVQSAQPKDGGDGAFYVLLRRQL